MNVVGYVRVSTHKQVEEGLGREVQREAIESWCVAEGHSLIAMHCDDGVSGTVESADRPGLGKALIAVEDTAEALVVYRLDRLARHLIVQETVMERLGKLGRRVFSVSEPDVDDGDPTRVLIRQVLGAISQYERSVINARMAAGRRLKHTRGGYAGYGSPSFGWKSAGGELVADLTEQRTIARMVQMRDAGNSLRDIAAALNDEGLRSKRGGEWHVETVRRALRRVDTAKEAERSQQMKIAEAEALRLLARSE